MGGGALQIRPELTSAVGTWVAELLEAVRYRGQIAAQLVRAFERIQNLANMELVTAQLMAPVRSYVAGHELAESLRDGLRPHRVAELPPGVLVDATGID